MNFSFSHFSSTGPRETNQDRLLEPIATERGVLLAIADGVGGSVGGERAAEIAIEAVRSSTDVDDDLDAIFSTTVLRIREEASIRENFRKMATTLTVALISEQTISVRHVGDARAYHLRGNGLNTLSEDQTEVAELLRKGIITRYQADRYPRRGVLTSALSSRADYQVFSRTVEWQAGDRLLLLTDGVYNSVPRRLILKLSLENAVVTDFIANLQSLTEASEPTDNYTALAVDLG